MERNWRQNFTGPIYRIYDPSGRYLKPFGEFETRNGRPAADRRGEKYHQFSTPPRIQEGPGTLKTVLVVVLITSILLGICGIGIWLAFYTSSKKAFIIWKNTIKIYSVESQQSWTYITVTFLFLQKSYSKNFFEKSRVFLYE